MSFMIRPHVRELSQPVRSYPISAHLEYRLIAGERVSRTGEAWTTMISSRRVLFESADCLPINTLVELAVTWPVTLDNKVGLKLHIRGRTVPVAGNCTAIDILRYEFRTRSLRTPAKGQRLAAPVSAVRAMAACASSPTDMGRR